MQGNTDGTRVSVCIGCEGGAALAAALEALSPPVAAQRVPCMNVCDNPACVSVRATGKPAYLFAGVGAGQAAEVAAFRAMFEGSETGEIADARPLGRLRFCLIGRIPA